MTIVAARQGPPGTPGPPGLGTTPVAITATATPNTYSLAIAPIDPAAVLLFINGAKQRYGADYNIVGTVINWISPNLSLSPDDTIEVYS